MLEEKPDVRDESQESHSKSIDNQSILETVADLNTGGSDEDFGSVRKIEQRNVAKAKTGDEQFKEKMDRCSARWEIGKNIKVEELRSEAREKIPNSKL